MIFFLDKMEMRFSSEDRVRDYFDCNEGIDTVLDYNPREDTANVNCENLERDDTIWVQPLKLVGSFLSAPYLQFHYCLFMHWHLPLPRIKMSASVSTRKKG